MSEKYTLSLEPRAVVGKKVKRLRRSGILPATVYGKGIEPISVQVDARSFNAVYRRAGRTALVELHIAGRQPLAAFIHALQRHPVTRDIIHADFRAVDLSQEVEVAVPLHIEGESPLVESGEAVLNQVLNAIEIRALPSNIPAHLTVDISGLDAFDKSIHVRDLALPPGVTLATPADELVVSLAHARAAEEEAPAAEETTAEPELVRERREPRAEEEEE
ncbi:50S ribosomal protein L25 [Roseiflexus sp.]|uniref:50S ribosomal protein L25 n=1 Tax=Roseiflexus sp. TaxID=2562120 RepID=UPI0021DBDF0F|nr:50S ribosomal protein L25 [Roseiflexus sp.]GIW00007.1 MAG: 50S ribosomal protein L25 [Roseiflexus sp.]